MTPAVKLELEGLRRKIWLAEQELELAMLRHFPPGADVTWERGGHIQHGKVLDAGDFDRLKVRNDRTDNELWISLYDVLQAEPHGAAHVEEPSP